MLFIKNGEVVDTKEGIMRHCDVFISEGVIKAMAPWGEMEVPEGAKVLDAKGKIVAPGLLDMHVHLREPGEEYKETIESGCKAAVAGGFVAVLSMPNTRPVNDNASVTQYIIKRANEVGLAQVYPVGAITVGQKGEVLSEFGDLRAAGAVAVSDDGKCVMDSGLMRRAMEYASFFGLRVISHCEDTNLSEGGQMHEGVVSAHIGLKGIPAEAEEIMVFREIALSKLTGVPIHIAHVSTKGSVELIRWAKSKDILVTAETAPHYFTLDHNELSGYNTLAKVNPPLRTPQDVAAIIEGLSDGTIDAIATDHAPHSVLEKEVEFDKASPGMVGLELAVPLALTLVRNGALSMPEAIRKMSLNPCRILDIEGGAIEVNKKADICIIDPTVEWEVTPEELYSKGKNTPFLGRVLKGRNMVTIIGGEVVFARP